MILFSLIFILRLFLFSPFFFHFYHSFSFFPLFFSLYLHLPTNSIFPASSSPSPRPLVLLPLLLHFLPLCPLFLSSLFFLLQLLLLLSLFPFHLLLYLLRRHLLLLLPLFLNQLPPSPLPSPPPPTSSSPPPSLSFSSKKGKELKSV